MFARGFRIFCCCFCCGGGCGWLCCCCCCRCCRCYCCTTRLYEMIVLLVMLWPARCFSFSSHLHGDWVRIQARCAACCCCLLLFLLWCSDERIYTSQFDFVLFYKKLKNVSCEYDRVNGWNSTLQAACYIRYLHKLSFARVLCFIILLLPPDHV